MRMSEENTKGLEKVEGKRQAFLHPALPLCFTPRLALSLGGEGETTKAAPLQQ